MSRLGFVLNGPNLNLFGKPQPHIYGHEMPADVERDWRPLAEDSKLKLRFHRGNREHEISAVSRNSWMGRQISMPGAKANHVTLAVMGTTAAAQPVGLQ
jgi:3-dehydroquinate dehydratase